MKIVGKDMSMIRGDSEAIVISCQDKSGNKISFQNGDKVYLTVKESIHTEAKILQKVITEFTDGNAIVEIEPEDTKSIKYNVYKYDVQFIKLDGKVTTIIPPSDFTIVGEVTYE